MGFTISSSIKTICLLILALAAATTARTVTICPFDYLHHFGDGVFDNGNAIARPFGFLLPAAREPYGITLGGANGRWSDGLLEVDYGVFPYPDTAAYLSANGTSAKAVMFATARSPVLDRSFFKARGIKVPHFVAPIKVQIKWYKEYLKSSSTGVTDRIQRSLILFGDVEANDLTYGLLQGKSIEEVTSYITYITQAQINAARELLELGADRVIIPGSGPIGCYPFILTALGTDNPDDYDDIGCLKSVNDLIKLKNNDLLEAANKLRAEFPDPLIISYADLYGGLVETIRLSVVANGTRALQACCGIGGKYNYSEKKFCGSPGVPVCSDPFSYVFWDGIHWTQGAYKRFSDLVEQQSLPLLGCYKETVPDSDLHSAI